MAPQGAYLVPSYQVLTKAYCKPWYKDMDNAEEAGVEPTVLEEPSERATKSCAVHDPVGDDSVMYSSGCSSNMTNTECDTDPIPLLE
ncbi:hypothetical protein HPB51_008672 [Rhipicephalus microplus]|uniref:Uncharacterized protein n=1 Tax=Rhipicephalus microplus TaxID=6941 RepID=A0A9J6E8W4_RHIMP|nr:hypothetical protein HPB51_008672 [Rhipicephalus microplus]